MKAEQERLYQLLDEIDQVCGRRKVCYFLIGKELLWHVTANNPFRCSADICMTLQDFKYIYSDLAGLSNRKIEDLSSNNDMPGVYYRFTDIESLMIEFAYHKVLKEFGIAVNIHIIRKLCPASSKLESLEQIMESGIEGVEKRFSVQEEKAFLKLKQSSDYHDTIYGMLEDSAFVNGDDSSGSFLNLPGEEKIKLPPGFWKKTTYISAAGRKYMTVYDKEAYLSAHYGGYSSVTPYAASFPGNMVADAGVPYKDVADEIIAELIDEDYWESRKFFFKAYFDNYDKMVRERTIVNDYMLTSADRIILWKYYFPVKKKILGLHDQKRFDELRLIFDKMEEHIKKYEGSGYLCVFDKDIWDTYLEMLKTQGEADRAEELEELYKNNPFKELENTKELEQFISAETPPIWRTIDESR